jgi:hypothetical protein
MYLGYQNNKIAFVADTREELENLPCVVLDKIEETDVEYVSHNGEYIPKAEADAEAKKEEIEARIAELESYLASTDWYAIRESETGIDIPADIKQARADARVEISTLRGDI